MRNIFFISIILLGFACELSAQQEALDGDYVIREEDVISIIVRGESEYNVEARPVRMDGKITMPLLGDILVSGKTKGNLEAEITEMLRIYLIDPLVQIFLERTPSHKLTVAGNVGRPGDYALTSPTTVLQALMNAGGPTEKAKVKKILIVREVNGREMQFRFNYKEVLQGKNLRQNILLENRDYILVP